VSLKEENSILESVLSFLKDHATEEGSTPQQDYDEAKGFILGIEEEEVSHPFSLKANSDET
jgi:hypothetical protein